MCFTSLREFAASQHKTRSTCRRSIQCHSMLCFHPSARLLTHRVHTCIVMNECGGNVWTKINSEMWGKHVRGTNTRERIANAKSVRAGKITRYFKMRF